MYSTDSSALCSSCSRPTAAVAGKYWKWKENAEWSSASLDVSPPHTKYRLLCHLLSLSWGFTVSLMNTVAYNISKPVNQSINLLCYRSYIQEVHQRTKLAGPVSFWVQSLYRIVRCVYICWRLRAACQGLGLSVKISVFCFVLLLSWRLRKGVWRYVILRRDAVQYSTQYRVL